MPYVDDAYDVCMTSDTLVQARLSPEYARQVDHDIAALGLHNRSEAVREGLRLLHSRAAQAELAREYDEFYGGAEAPMSDVTAVGDELAAEVMASHDETP